MENRDYVSVRLAMSVTTAMQLQSSEWGYKCPGLQFVEFTALDNMEILEAPGQSAWNPCGHRRELWRVSHAGNRTEENLFKYSSGPRSHVKPHLGGAVHRRYDVTQCITGAANSSSTWSRLHIQ